MAVNLKGRSFLTLMDFTPEEIRYLLDLSHDLKSKKRAGIHNEVLKGKNVVLLFEKTSTRTRCAFEVACLDEGAHVTFLDSKSSQMGKKESLEDTAKVLGRFYDGIEYRGYDQKVVEGLAQHAGVPVWNGLTDVDHPTQCMADMLHIIHHFGGVENLKGKKVAMTWAYSPSYGKPLSVPQGVIGLFTRFGMDVTLAHPEGYDVMPEVEEVARKNCEKYGSKFHKTNDMKEVFKDADIVYPKSWASYAAMEERTKLYAAGDKDGIDALEKRLLAQNAEHKDWACTEEMMKLTKDGKALYLHCLPADITGLSCDEGEVDNSVFDRYIVPLYKQASYKPYIIAAMIFMAQVKDPVKALMELDEGKNNRKIF